MQVAECAVGPVSVNAVSDYGAFVDLEAEWNDAVERARVPHPFLRHEWFRTWWECFGGDSRLHVLVVRSAGRVIALAPLMSESSRMCGLPVRRLRLMHNDHTPRADFIVTDQPDAAYQAIWSALADDAEGWDVLQLGQLTTDSPTRTLLPMLASADGCMTGFWRSSESPYLPLTGTWDSYFATLAGKFRSNVRNRVARLRRIGEPVFEEITGGAQLDEACADVIRLEASGWKKQEGTAIASHDAICRFYTQFARRAAARGWLRLQFLSVGGRRIATSYSLSYGGKLFFCKTGYDPEFETGSPFKVLTSFAVRDAFERGYDEVDFLGDAEAWKLEWTTTVRSHEWVFVFSNTQRARMVYPLKFKIAPAVRSMFTRA